MTSTQITQTQPWWETANTQTLIDMLPVDGNKEVTPAEVNSMLIGVLRRCGILDQTIRDLACQA